MEKNVNKIAGERCIERRDRIALSLDSSKRQTRGEATPSTACVSS